MSAVHYHLGAFPPPVLDWPVLLPLIGPANAALARYAGLIDAIAGTNVLLSPLTVQEAVLSSRIEGTQATMGEVLEMEAGGRRSCASRNSSISRRAAMYSDSGFDDHRCASKWFVDHVTRFRDCQKWLWCIGERQMGHAI